MADQTIYSPEMQSKIKQLVGLGWMSKGKLDYFSTIKYLLMDIHRKNKKTGVHFLGFDTPEEQPFLVPTSAYRASTSSSIYNPNLIEAGKTKIEYDFNEAYSVIMRNYPLPSNTVLNVKYDTDKALDRIIVRPDHRAYVDLNTYSIFLVTFSGKAKKGTYADPDGQGMLADYGMNPITPKPIWISEIELKILIDFYELETLNVLSSYTYLCKKGLLKEYFERIEPLKTDPDTLKLYKSLRTRIFGAIGQKTLNKGEKDVFNKYQMYNRAYSSMVAGVFRDQMVRYEQKYVDSEYGLIQIKTDGLYFREPVPEFENLYRKGVVKKKVHTITQEDEDQAKEFIAKGFEAKKANKPMAGIVISDDEEFEFDFDN